MRPWMAGVLGLLTLLLLLALYAIGSFLSAYPDSWETN
jgi:hypothetical protein